MLNIALQLIVVTLLFSGSVNSHAATPIRKAVIGPAALNARVAPPMGCRGSWVLRQPSRQCQRDLYPASAGVGGGVDGLRNIQRLMKLRNPAIEKFNIEEMIDDRILRQLDASGFIDGLAKLYPAK